MSEDQQHLRPRVAGWRRLDDWRAPGVISGAVYARDGLRVISALTIADYPDRRGRGPQHHVSISCRGRRPSRREMRLVSAQFGLGGFEEDNHHPGIARHLWQPLDPAHRVDCECKTSETVVREGSYAWSNPTAGPCRGYTYATMSGTACPVHG